jgi:hypothetical protein
MMLVEIEASFGTKITKEQRNLLESRSVSVLKFVDDEDGSMRLDWCYYPIISADLLEHFVGWTVRRVINNQSTRKLTEFGQRTTVVTNDRCHVAVAGLGLLTINEVEVQVDCCTDHLNRKLQEGWKIVAVCVQPDQRRPDYVLGRTNEASPERERGS